MYHINIIYTYTHSIIICDHNVITTQGKYMRYMIALTRVQQKYYTKKKKELIRTAVSAVPGTHQCDPQNSLGHVLCSHPAYCKRWIQQCVITMSTVIGQLTNYILY